MTPTLWKAILSVTLVAGVAVATPRPANADLAGLARQVVGQGASVTIVLIDSSTSVARADRALYEASLRNASAGLRGGDRLLVAAIGDETRSSFRPGLDQSVPRKAARLDQEDELRASRRRMDAAIPGLLTGAKPARNTRILEAIVASAPAFGPTPRKGSRLILLTDGVEESRVLDLARAPLTPEGASRAIGRARAEGLVPNLRGVELSVVGAGGAHYESVRGFWVAYAAATGATLRQYDRLELRR